MAQNDIDDARKTYSSFIGLTKVSLVAIVLVTLLVVLLIS